MSPGEEDNEEFPNNIAIRDVEVVFQRGHVDVSVDLLLFYC